MSDILKLPPVGLESVVHEGCSGAPGFRVNDDGSVEFFATGDDYVSSGDFHGVWTHRTVDGELVGVRIEWATERANAWLAKKHGEPAKDD